MPHLVQGYNVRCMPIAPEVVDEITGYAIEPGDDAPFFAIGINVGKSAEKDVARQVLRRLSVADLIVNEAIDRPHMRPVQSLSSHRYMLWYRPLSTHSVLHEPKIAAQAST